MRAHRWSTTFTAIGMFAVVAAAFIRFSRLDAPEYAISTAGQTVELHADESPQRAGELNQRFDLNVINTGRKPFRITGARASCSCTVAGTISGNPVAAGQSVTIPLEVQFPAFGSKRTALTILTDAQPIEATELTLRLHGPKISAPFIESIGGPVQLTTHSPGELVEFEFEVLTTEELQGGPWIERIATSHDDSNVEDLGSQTLAEFPEVNIARRRYLFLLRMIGPENDGDVTVITLTPQTKSVPVRAGLLPMFRCTLGMEAAFIALE